MRLLLGKFRVNVTSRSLRRHSKSHRSALNLRAGRAREVYQSKKSTWKPQSIGKYF